MVRPMRRALGDLVRPAFRIHALGLPEPDICTAQRLHDVNKGSFRRAGGSGAHIADGGNRNAFHVLLMALRLISATMLAEINELWPKVRYVCGNPRIIISSWGHYPHLLKGIEVQKDLL